MAALRDAFAEPLFRVVLMVVAAFAILGGVASAMDAPTVADQHGEHVRCFSPKLWSARDYIRPCASIVRVDEDGSVRLRVFDHGGVTRYTVGVGNMDGCVAAVRRGVVRPDGSPLSNRCHR